MVSSLPGLIVNMVGRHANGSSVSSTTSVYILTIGLFVVVFVGLMIPVAAYSPFWGWRAYYHFIELRYGFKYAMFIPNEKTITTDTLNYIHRRKVWGRTADIRTAFDGSWCYFHVLGERRYMLFRTESDALMFKMKNF